MSDPERLVIATRASRLAVWQAEHVRGRLLALYPGCQVELLTLSTRGDQILDRTLSKIGGKGLFVKELENALADGRADLAVHSLKDVPVDMPEAFELCTILAREDPRDALVSNDYDSLGALPAGAVVGTSSLRRESQIRARFPTLEIKPLRGNLDTRLGKLDRGEYAAIVLAAAGLKRLGLASRIKMVLPVELSLPAPGQGTLGIEIRVDRAAVRDWLNPLACESSTLCAIAERALSRELGGSCQLPLAAYARLEQGQLVLQGLVASPDGRQIARAQTQGPAQAAQALGQALARNLLDGGAQSILDGLAQP